MGVCFRAYFTNSHSVDCGSACLHDICMPLNFHNDNSQRDAGTRCLSVAGDSCRGISGCRVDAEWPPSGFFPCKFTKPNSPQRIGVGNRLGVAANNFCIMGDWFDFENRSGSIQHDI